MARGILTHGTVLLISFFSLIVHLFRCAGSCGTWDLFFLSAAACRLLACGRKSGRVVHLWEEWVCWAGGARFPVPAVLGARCPARNDLCLSVCLPIWPVGSLKDRRVCLPSYPQHDLNHMRNEKPYRKKLKYFKKAKLQPHRILFLCCLMSKNQKVSAHTWPMSL